MTLKKWVKESKPHSQNYFAKTTHAGSINQPVIIQEFDVQRIELISTRDAPIRIFEADHRSQKAVSADPITDTDLFEAFFLLCRIIYSDTPIRIFRHLFRAWI